MTVVFECSCLLGNARELLLNLPDETLKDRVLVVSMVDQNALCTCQARKRTTLAIRAEKLQSSSFVINFLATHPVLVQSEVSKQGGSRSDHQSFIHRNITRIKFLLVERLRGEFQ